MRSAKRPKTRNKEAKEMQFWTFRIRRGDIQRSPYQGFVTKGVWQAVSGSPIRRKEKNMSIRPRAVGEARRKKRRGCGKKTVGERKKKLMRGLVGREPNRGKGIKKGPSAPHQEREVLRNMFSKITMIGPSGAPSAIMPGAGKLRGGKLQAARDKKSAGPLWGERKRRTGIKRDGGNSGDQTRHGSFITKVVSRRQRLEKLLPPRSVIDKGAGASGVSLEAIDAHRKYERGDGAQL